MFFAAADTLGFATGGSERMRIDSSGNTTFAGSLDVGNFTFSGSGIVADAGMTIQTGGGSVNAITLASDGDTTFAGDVTTSRLFVEQSAADMIDMTRTGVGTYRFAISGSDAFSLFDVGANSDRLIIDSAGNVGIGGSPATVTHNPHLDIVGNRGTLTVGTGYFEDNGSTNFLNGARPLAFGTGGTEAMRITSAGQVGIGTASPAELLHIYSSGHTKMEIEGGASGDASLMLTETGSTGFSLDYDGGDNKFFISSGTAGTFTPKITIERDSGNVGIGTDTPSSLLEIQTASTSGSADFQIFSRGESPNYEVLKISRSAGDAEILSNQNLILSADYDNNHTGANSNIKFKTDNTERMRIDSAGNVGIGTTAPTGDLSVGSTTTTSGDIHLRTSKTTVTLTPSNTAAGGFDIDTGFVSGGQGPMTLSIGGSEKMRIDSAGNVGIGITPTAPLHVAGTIQSVTGATTIQMFSTGGSGVISQVGSYPLTFLTNSAERMRITSTGDVLIGTTIGSIGSAKISLQTAGGRGYGFNDTAGQAGTKAAIFHSQGTEVGSISITSSATSYISASDYRLKENVVEMTGALDRVAQLKPSRFNFIADSDTTVDGFLAHEVQSVVPEAITGTKDGMKDEEYKKTPAVYKDKVHPAIEEVKDEEGNVTTEAKESWTENVLVSEAVMATRSVEDYQGIDQSKLVPLLVGAIQELRAEIELLKAK